MIGSGFLRVLGTRMPPSAISILAGLRMTAVDWLQTSGSGKRDSPLADAPEDTRTDVRGRLTAADGWRCFTVCGGCAGSAMPLLAGRGPCRIA
jgi:hypothetical protein